jgi:hypothetical protein
MFKHEEQQKGRRRRGKFNLMTIPSPIKQTKKKENVIIMLTIGNL